VVSHDHHFKFRQQAPIDFETRYGVDASPSKLYPRLRNGTKSKRSEPVAPGWSQSLKLVNFSIVSVLKAHLERRVELPNMDAVS
jgi:hypothetical protein